MNICIIGIGYVGLVSGVCFAELGNKVICVDAVKEKIEKLNNGIMPIYEEGLKELCTRNYAKGAIEFTTDLEYGVKSSDIIFIAVGTPPLPSGQADLSCIESVAKDIALYMNDYKVIVNKSTVPIGTQKRITKIIRDSQMRPVDFDVVSNPEFLKEGTAVYDTMNPDRIIVGAESNKAIEILCKLHESFDAPVVVTDPESAEMIKYAANAFLATKITFMNEIANICEKIGADVSEVAKGIGLDSRIGNKFLKAGIGYGGACFPKDISALVKIGEKVGYDFKVIKSVVEVNKNQKLIPVEKLKRAMPTIKGKKICILGLAFKPKTDDVRGAPAIAIINEIQKLGGKVKAYDPVAMESAQNILKAIDYAKDAYDAVEGADAIILATEWKEFKNLDLKKVKSLAEGNVFIDGRNVFDYKTMKQLGFEYYCIGKKDASYPANEAMDEAAVTTEERIGIADYKIKENYKTI